MFYPSDQSLEAVTKPRRSRMIPIHAGGFETAS